eukprot:14727308-Alexandrium_andersonii.AAC.1
MQYGWTIDTAKAFGTRLGPSLRLCSGTGSWARRSLVRSRRPGERSADGPPLAERWPPTASGACW